MKKNKLLASRLSVIFFILFMNITISAQGLIIGGGTTFSLGSSTLSLSGNWDNSGTFNTGFGTVIFTGSSGNQTITNSSGETFYNLILNKSAGDLQLNSNIKVNNNLTVISGDIDLNGKVITLDSNALLSETPGNTVKGRSGKITITKDIGTPSQVNVGGLGAVITSASNLGNTTVERYHSAAAVDSNQGILRQFNITPANNSNLNADFSFYYDESELNGIGEDTLSLFRSPDGSDNSWNFLIGSAVNTTDNYVELSGISDFSYWTLAGSTTFASIQISNQTIDFNDVETDSSAQRSITIKNIGNATLIVDTITSSDPAFEVNLKSFSVATGDSQEVVLTFQPLDTTLYNDTISIVHNSQESPTEILVIGQGISGGLTGIKDKSLPTHYSLLQNYPNPFNPSTIISWQLPMGGHVSLKIYDILGNEVATLVNEEKPAGNYKIEYDASKLSSGIYFYRIQAGSFNQVRKMLMIK